MKIEDSSTKLGNLYLWDLDRMALETKLGTLYLWDLDRMALETCWERWKHAGKPELGLFEAKACGRVLK